VEPVNGLECCAFWGRGAGEAGDEREGADAGAVPGAGAGGDALLLLQPGRPLDPAELLADLWAGEFEEPDNEADEDLDDDFLAMIAPFSREFPGLAPAADQQLTPREIEQALGSLRPARIGLAAASRRADVLPLIGWDGAANHWEDALVIAAVLRSWEDRFGARLLRVGFAVIQLLAERPPRRPGLRSDHAQ